MPRSPILRGAAIGAICAALVCALALADPDLFGSEWLLRDAFTRSIARHRPLDDRIVLVRIGDDTIRALQELNYGRPPYPRDLFALAVRELQRAGATVIAIDVLFTEADAVHPEADREFARTIEGAPVVLAAQLFDEPAPLPPALAPRLWSIPGGAPHKLLPPIFTNASLGAIRISRSSAVVHNYELAGPVAPGLWIGSLALESARTFLALPRRAAVRNDHLEFGPDRVPLTGNEMVLRWHTVPNERWVHFDRLIVAALAHDEPGVIDPATLAKFEAQFRNKIVLIGYTAAGSFDLRSTPLDPIAPGLVLHANAIDNLINRDFNRLAPRPLAIALTFLIAILFGAALFPRPGQIESALLALAAIAAVTAAVYLAMSRGLLFPGVTLAGTLAFTYISITVVKYVAEQEQSAMLKSTFGRYVSPQILDHILAHPERVHLGGERRELTILFSDIRGFTTISEASEPEEVVEMLNEYLTKMVEILLAHGGTLDKFIGDAVMGFWNAPAPDPDHARHAVACAVEMVAETARLGEKWVREGKQAIRIGVGVNTGEAVVGNIGAEQVFGYTVIGDAVNLASRLEGKNKDYGTEIIVSEFTLERMGEVFETVYLDEVKVKGKEKAVRIYQVKG